MFPTPIAMYTQEEMFTHVLRMIESLLPEIDRSQKQSRHHPLIDVYESVSKLQQGASSHEMDTQFDEILLGLMRFLSDVSFWTNGLPVEDIWSFIQDERQKNEVVSRISDGELYDDTMFELYTLGALTKHSIKVELVGGDGNPDICVFDENGERTYGECKNFHVGTSRQRVLSILKKANKQIKVVSPERPGVVFVRLDRDMHSSFVGQVAPSEVKRFESEITYALGRGLLRSIGAVVLVWDEPMMVDHPGEHTSLFINRNSSITYHPNPVGQVSIPNEYLEVGCSIYIRLLGNSFGPYSGDDYIHRSFEGYLIRIPIGLLNELESRWFTRGSQVTFAIDEYDGVGEIVLVDRVFTVFGKSQTMFHRLHTLVVLAEHMEGKELIVVGAFRIQTQSELDEMFGRRPDLAILELVRRHSRSCISGHDAQGRVFFPDGLEIDVESYGAELERIYTNVNWDVC